MIYTFLLNSYLSGKVGSCLGGEVGSYLFGKVGSCFGGKVGPCLGGKVGSCFGGKVGPCLGGKVGSCLGGKAYSSLKLLRGLALVEVEGLVVVVVGVLPGRSIEYCLRPVLFKLDLEVAEVAF